MKKIPNFTRILINLKSIGFFTQFLYKYFYFSILIKNIF